MKYKFIDGPLATREQDFDQALKFIEVPVADPEKVWKQGPEVVPIIGERRSFLYQALPALGGENRYKWAVPADWSVEQARSQNLVSDETLARMTLKEAKGFQAQELLRFAELSEKTVIEETVVFGWWRQEETRSTLIRVEGYLR